MAQIIYDSFFGRTLRFVSGGRLLAFQEDKNPALLKPFEIQSEDSSSSKASSEYAADEKTAEKGTAGGNDGHIVVGWYGDDDPEKPQNWSALTKTVVTIELSFLTFAVYSGSSIYAMGIEGVMSDFGVSEVVATLGLSVFVLGYGVGPMTLAPMSEVPAIGRNAVYIYSLFAFVLLQIPTALSTNIAMLVVFRFITGILASPALATGGACIAELYTPQNRALALGLWGVASVCGPVLGPLIGGFAAEAHGWRWTIWALMWLCGLALVILFFCLPETSSKNILYRRARRLRKLTGNDRLKSEAEIAFQHVTVGKIAQMMIVRPWILTFQEPVVFLLHTWSALISGVLFIWFESFPLVFQGIYGFSLGLTGLAFLGFLVGAAFMVPFFIWYNRKFQRKQFDDKGNIIRPELRLPPAMLGAFGLPISLFFYGWSARPDVHWVVPMIGTMFFSIGALLVLNSILSYLPDTYPTEIPSVMAGNAFMRFATGAGFPLFAPAMFRHLGIPWGNSLLGFLGLLFTPIPFVFYFYGSRLRKISKRARHD